MNFNVLLGIGSCPRHQVSCGHYYGGPLYEASQGVPEDLIGWLSRVGKEGNHPSASKHVFYHPESLARWDTCKKPWEEAREAAGHLWLRIHDLRHAYGIRLAEAGCAMHFISEVMGHHSVDYTRRQ